MIKIQLPTVEYPVIFTDEPFAEIKKRLSRKVKLAVITDTNLQKLYGRYIAELRSECMVEILSFSAGEKQKNMHTVQEFTDALQAYRFGKKETLVVALGGGVVGDIAGFVAGIYLRGVPYIQMPTTLLAMVDSSIGGKTGVNTAYGKNMLGTIYHPQKVVISPFFLRKLPEAEIRNGLSEMVKHAVLDSERHLKELQRSIPKILAKDAAVTLKMVKKSIKVKKKHVEGDETEAKGIRSFLNFGHTIGHAIEKTSGYNIPHGQAIAMGMALESKLAEKEFGFKGRELLLQTLEKCGLPTALPQGMTVDDLHKHLRQDKKNEGEKITYALPKEFGKMQLKSF